MCIKRLYVCIDMHYLPKLTAILAPGTGEKNAIAFYYISAKVLYRNPKRQFNFLQNQVINGMFM